MYHNQWENIPLGLYTMNLYDLFSRYVVCILNSLFSGIHCIFMTLMFSQGCEYLKITVIYGFQCDNTCDRRQVTCDT